MKADTLIKYTGRKCFEGVRPTGEDGPYRCRRDATVVVYSRAWCELHDPRVTALDMAFALLIQVTRRAA